MIRDVNNAEFEKEEPRGANKKSWLKLEFKGRLRRGLFKPTYVRPDGTNTQTHFGELLYADICKRLLDFPCADIELAERNGQLGCMSYNVLENIPNNNEDYTRYNLIDMVSIIQRIRADFDANGLKVKGTHEFYSLDLLMEAIDNYVPNPEQNRAYKDYLLELCLIDSATNYFDRHALNLAAAEERTTGDVIPPETFDNGTCFALGIRKDDLKQYLESEDGIKHLRKQFNSKIGIDVLAPVPFERLETLIFNHYFAESEPLFKKIQERLTIEGVEEILKLEDYDTLDPIYKKSIVEQLKYNRETMRERYEKSKKRNEIEKLVHADTSRENLNQRLKEYFNSENLNLDGEILDELSFQSLKNIDHIPDEFQSGAVRLSYRDKNLAQWTIIMTNIMRRMDSELPLEAKQALLKEFMVERFNFCQKDIDKIEKLVGVYEFRLDEDTAISARRFILGGRGTEGLGTDCVRPFIAMKLGESDVSERHKERYEKFIELYSEVLAKEEFIAENIPFDYKKPDEFKRIGITDHEETMEILYSAVDAIKREGRRFSSIKEFREFINNVARETFKDRKTEVNGILVDNDVKDFLEQNTYTTPDGKKITILTETIKNSDFLSYKLGASYFVSIADAQNSAGRSLVLSAREGEFLPEEVIDYAERKKEEFLKIYQREPRSGELTIAQSRKNKKWKDPKKIPVKTGSLVSIGASQKSDYALTETTDELKKIVLGLFKTKERENK